jgi:CheY-like chemotaxis protein
MDVISEPDAGTTMIVHLPRPDDPDLLGADDKSEAGIVPGSGTVLIVDDEEGVRTVASGILRQAGYAVHLAESGEAGVRLFHEKRGAIDAVLLDMSMPGMSGLEVFEALRAIDPGVPVLISSGFSLDIKIKKAMDLGARGFVQKPYSARVLTEKMGDAVSLRG